VQGVWRREWCSRRPDFFCPKLVGISPPCYVDRATTATDPAGVEFVEKKIRLVLT